MKIQTLTNELREATAAAIRFTESPQFTVDLLGAAGMTVTFAVGALRSALATAKAKGETHPSWSFRHRWTEALRVIERENEDDQDYFNESVTQAEAEFWAHMAKRYPDINTGDLQSDATTEFLDACVDAASAWLRENGHSAPGRCGADPDPSPTPVINEWESMGPDKFLASLEPIPDWKPTWDGEVVTWSYTGRVPGFEHLTVYAAPQIHDDDRISVMVLLDRSKGISYQGDVRDLPWTKGARTRATYFAAVSELLLRFTPAVVIAKYHMIGFTDEEVNHFTGELSIAAEGDDNRPDAFLVSVEVE